MAEQSYQTRRRAEFVFWPPIAGALAAWEFRIRRLPVVPGFWRELTIAELWTLAEAELRGRPG